MWHRLLVVLAVVLLLWAVVPPASAYVPSDQWVENYCECYSLVCWFIAEYQPNGLPGDGQPEFILLWMRVPESAVAELISGNWACW